MVLLIDIGNTHVHIALAARAVFSRKACWPTSLWKDGSGNRALRAWLGTTKLSGVSVASVVPKTTPRLSSFLQSHYHCPVLILGPKTLRGLPIDYPMPKTIGPDRLANALAAFVREGAPVLAVDAGTAVTFDVVDSRGFFVGGVIAPGRGLLASILHERTALLPRIQLETVSRAIGHSTREAMTIGANLGWLGLVKEIIAGITSEMAVPRLPLIFTGGDGAWLASKMKGLGTHVPNLTWEGLLRNWHDHHGDANKDKL
jgi:type III pantothenate kinase